MLNIYTFTKPGPQLIKSPVKNDQLWIPWILQLFSTSVRKLFQSHLKTVDSCIRSNLGFSVFLKDFLASGCRSWEQTNNLLIKRQSTGPLNPSTGPGLVWPSWGTGLWLLFKLNVRLDLAVKNTELEHVVKWLLPCFKGCGHDLELSEIALDLHWRQSQ